MNIQCFLIGSTFLHQVYTSLARIMQFMSMQITLFWHWKSPIHPLPAWWFWGWILTFGRAVLGCWKLLL